MPLSAGTRLGSYEVLGLLGVGGMGEVYRARDIKLNREVALKILPDTFTADPDRLARFKREAQVLASLNHPNIAAIYGLEGRERQEGREGEILALVLELVEGPTLADRIARGPLPLDEALPIARQIADALEAAHEQGIVHRDLKPANIKVRPDGMVKVLDFGLAKALDGAGGADAVSQAPTLANPANLRQGYGGQAMTQVGMLLGTAAYMSPEQAKGRAADKRSDIWAFGCVLFEMLAGKRAFGGDNVSDTLAAVLRADPDWTSLPQLPPAITRLLRRSLDKERKHRLADIADARLDLDEREQGASVDAGQHASKTQRPVPWIVAALGAFITGLAVTSLMRITREPSVGPVVRFSVHDTDRLIISRGDGDMALSPDGQMLAFVGFAQGSARIWVRPFGSVDAHSLPGTDGASWIAWSPDSRSLAFTAHGQEKRITVAGGTPEILSSMSREGSAKTWGPDGTIIDTVSAPQLRLRRADGQPPKVIPRDADETYHSPAFLPDGRRFLFSIVSSNPATTGTFVATVDDSTRARVLSFPAPARYASGHLLYVRDRALYAQACDLSRLQLTGDPTPVADQVSPTFSVSTTGVLAYTPLTDSAQADAGQLLWMNRDGQVVGRIDQATGASRPAISPDGRYLAMSLRGDVWVLEVRRGVLSRVTSAGGNNATWLPNSRQLTFVRAARGTAKDIIFSTQVDSVGQDALVREPDGLHAHVTDVSADGKYLVYEGEDAEYDLWVMRLAADGSAKPYVRTPALEAQATLSPDTRWIAYTSDSSGRFDVYVESFPEPGVRIKVSPNGGSAARWRRDGQELFYLAPDGSLMSVPVRSASPLELGAPTALFQFSTPQRGVPAGKPPYDVTPDGQRFVVNAVIPRTTPSVQVVLNWPALLKQ